MTEVTLLSISAALRRWSHATAVLRWPTIDEGRAYPQIVRVDRDIQFAAPKGDERCPVPRRVHEVEVAEQCLQAPPGAVQVDVMPRGPQPAAGDPRLVGVEFPGVQVGDERPAAAVDGAEPAPR